MIAVPEKNKYFSEFKQIGSCTLSNNPNDLDYLIILKNDKSKEGLLELIEIIHTSIKNKSCSIISDSYFYPFISHYSNDTIIHLIFYYSKEAFEVDYFSRLVKNNLDKNIKLPSKERLSIILALQDIVKVWLLIKCNEISDSDLTLLRNTILYQTRKWLSEEKFITESETKTIKLILNDLNGISY